MLLTQLLANARQENTSTLPQQDDDSILTRNGDVQVE